MEPAPVNNSNENSEKATPNQLEPQKESLVFGRSEYAKKEFWDERFASSKGFFDWYLEYKQLKPYLEKVYTISKDSSILMVGCGNSKLSEEMYEDGYKNITNVDISAVVIRNMKEFYATKGITIECLEMDATNMTFPNCTFDVVIDKGTLDAIMCGKNMEITTKLIKEMTRVIKVEGKILIISHGGPASRKELFKSAVGLQNFEFMYSQQKLSDLSQLINIFRSKLKDKPLSHILKDKELLRESVNEFNALNKEAAWRRFAGLKEALYKRRVELDAEDAQKKEAETKELKEIKEEKQEEKDLEKDKEYQGDKNKDNSIENKQTQANESQRTPEEISKEAQEKSGYEQEKEVKSGQDTEYKPQRQSFCYVYCIKKKEHS